MKHIEMTLFLGLTSFAKMSLLPSRRIYC